MTSAFTADLEMRARRETSRTKTRCVGPAAVRAGARPVTPWHGGAPNRGGSAPRPSGTGYRLAPPRPIARSCDFDDPPGTA